MGRARGGFRSLHEHAPSVGLGGQRGFQLLGRDNLAVGHRKDRRVQPVGLGDLGPAFAEFAGHAHDHFIAARKKVRYAGIHRPGTRGGKHQDIVGRAHEFLEICQRRPVNFAEVFGAVVNIRSHHGVQGRRIERRRARR